MDIGELLNTARHLFSQRTLLQILSRFPKKTLDIVTVSLFYIMRVSWLVPLPIALKLPVRSVVCRAALAEKHFQPGAFP